LAKQNPDVYLPDVAMTLHNLAILLNLQSRMDEASRAAEEALKIRRDLVRQNPDTYLPDLAATLTTVGSLNVQRNRQAEARPVLQEALKIYEDLAKQNPQTFQPRVLRAKELLEGLPPVP
jgi:tetratricopeptide (TPR) repeat protein